MTSANPHRASLVDLSVAPFAVQLRTYDFVHQRKRWEWLPSTGSVVGSNTVLTAAHCVVEDSLAANGKYRHLKEYDPNRVEICFSNVVPVDGSMRNEWRGASDIARIVKYPQYNSGTFNPHHIGYLFDLAAIQFKTRINAPQIEPATSNDFRAMLDGSRGRLFGFSQNTRATRSLPCSL